MQERWEMLGFTRDQPGECFHVYRAATRDPYRDGAQNHKRGEVTAGSTGSVLWTIL